jgi:hypothetical protein
MAITVNHSTPADGTFSASGATAWDANHTLAGVGTMAEQDANAVAVTGGTINNTTIGATTPTTGNFTTITGQTEVLRGTGQNLLLYSQALATSTPWFNAGLTSIANNTTDVTDPLGGNTATKIVGLSSPNVVQYMNLNTFVYTFSIYLRTLSGSVSTRIQTFLGVPPYTAVGASTVTVTNSWQRFTFTTTAPPSFANYVFSIDSFGANTIYAWGAQQEIGSVTNTYIPTTTTAVYGTPTLSFSGVAGIGLQSDGSLYHQPAGTGAVQAQATTSSTVGGNARGANAVDWQTNRTVASQVATGQYSVISGGTGNTASAFNSTCVAGAGNFAQANYSFIGGGQGNATSGAFLQTYSVIGGGYANAANGFHNIVVGGASNSGTSISAVTTQSATMNGTTAVTLAASNANIKVGQFITGTSISDRTYVAAISGTSLTLSQAASGSSTSTLSFYTPHGVVVGGGNNQATGSYSFIGGGGDAGTAANRNVASGDWSFVGGGKANQATQVGAIVVGGGVFSTGQSGNIASGVSSFVGSGLSNLSSANYAFIGAGVGNTTSGQGSAIAGGVNGTARSIIGNAVFPACNSPIANASGVSQAALLVLARQTTDATATVLCSDSSAASGTNQVTLPNNSAYYFKGSVIAGVTGAGDTKGWSIEGVIKRGAGVGTTAIVGTATVSSLYADAGAATWAVTATADTTNGALKITVTGQAATTIRWVAKIESVEMTF